MEVLLVVGLHLNDLSRKPLPPLNLLDFDDPKTLQGLYDYLCNSFSGKELIGLCQGVVADGIVTVSESEYLLEWVSGLAQRPQNPLPKALVFRLKAYLERDFQNPTDREDLYSLLKEISKAKNCPSYQIFNEDIPYTSNQKNTLYNNKKICISGRCIVGNRQNCAKLIKSLGGFFTPSISGNTDILIVGSLRSPGWKEKPYGNKIRDAIDLVKTGKKNIQIIPEKQWITDLYNYEK